MDHDYANNGWSLSEMPEVRDNVQERLTCWKPTRWLHEDRSSAKG